MPEPFHADCHQCCSVGRCHFCRGVGSVEAAFEKDGVRYSIRLCPTHFAWASSNPRAPQILFDDAAWAESPSEPVRKSEAFQSAVLSMATR